MAAIADGQRKLQEEADAAAAAGDYARALSLLEQAAEAHDDSPELWMKLTAMRRTAGDTAGALKAVERALALYGADESLSFAYSVVLNVCGFLVVLAMGLPVLPILSVRLADLASRGEQALSDAPTSRPTS